MLFSAPLSRLSKPRECLVNPAKRARLAQYFQRLKHAKPHGFAGNGHPQGVNDLADLDPLGGNKGVECLLDFGRSKRLNRLQCGGKFGQQRPRIFCFDQSFLERLGVVFKGLVELKQLAILEDISGNFDSIARRPDDQPHATQGLGGRIFGEPAGGKQEAQTMLDTLGFAQLSLVSLLECQQLGGIKARWSL